MNDATEGVLHTVRPQNWESATDSVVTAAAGDVGVSVEPDQVLRLDDVEADPVTIEASVATAPAIGPRMFAAFEVGGRMFGRTEIVGSGDVVSLKKGQKVSLSVQRT